MSHGQVQLFATPWTVGLQAPPFMEFSRQEYWSGMPFPTSGLRPRFFVLSENLQFSIKMYKIQNLTVVPFCQ